MKKASQDQLKPVLLDFLAASNVSLTGYDLRQDARRFELYEKSRALTLGLSKAVAYALQIGLDRIWLRISELSTITRSALSDIGGISIHDSGDRKSGIIIFSVEGIDSAVIKSKLAERGISVSVGGAQATPIYMQKNKLETVVRASIHYYNTEAEISTMCGALSAIIEENDTGKK